MLGFTNEHFIAYWSHANLPRHDRLERGPQCHAGGYSAQQDNFSGFLNLEIATIFKVSAMVG
jgi:hypothetical protein